MHVLASLGRELGDDAHIRAIADWAGSGYQAVYDLYRGAREGSSGGAASTETLIALPPQTRAERELLRLLLHQPHLLGTARDELDPGLFEDRACLIILRALLEKADEAGTGELSREGLASELVGAIESEQARNAATTLIFDASGNVDNISREEAAVLYRDIQASLKEFYYERQIRRLKKELREISNAPRRDHQREQVLSEEIYSLERLKRELR